MIDHDRLFKELLSTFLVEFIELFLPEMMAYLEPESITFLDKEVFTDVTAGDKYEADLIAQVQFRGEPSLLEQVIPNARGKVVEIVTSWELRGIEKGIKQGREEGREEGRQGQIEIATFWLSSQLGQLPSMICYQIEGLSLIEIKQLNKQVLTFNSMDKLSEWLVTAEASEGFVGEKAELLNQLRQKVGAIAPKQKQKLLQLFPEQWQALSTQAFADVSALDDWLVSATDSQSEVL